MRRDLTGKVGKFEIPASISGSYPPDLTRKTGNFKIPASTSGNACWAYRENREKLLFREAKDMSQAQQTLKRLKQNLLSSHKFIFETSYSKSGRYFY